ncbi:hypothetical protein ACQ4PT_070863 [Festuca glaucescens]
MDITSELIWVQCGSCPATSCLRFLRGRRYKAHLVHLRLPRQRNVQLRHGVRRRYRVRLQRRHHVAGPRRLLRLPRLQQGDLSLVTQLQITSFSYFIAPDDTGYNFVSWNWDEDGAPAAVGSRPKSQSTPLLAPTANQNPYYYVKLTGLLVDGQPLTSIPAGTFDAQADGSGGVYMSTTLPVTYLKEAAYNALRRELVSKIQSQGVIPVDTPGDLYHLCFLTQYFANAKVPTLALVFDCADATMELTVNNYFFDLAYGQTRMSILPSTDVSVLSTLPSSGQGSGSWHEPV